LESPPAGKGIYSKEAERHEGKGWKGGKKKTVTIAGPISIFRADFGVENASDPELKQ